MVSEKHILQLKFLQKLPIDNQKIKKKGKLLGRNLLILDQTVNDLSCIYCFWHIHFMCDHMKMKYKVHFYPKNFG